MRILIVDTVSYERAPYLKYYEDACKECNVEYDMFLWDRYSDGGLKKQGNYYVYHKICPLGKGKLRKLFPMFQYRYQLLKTIKENNYTHFVLINTLASVMISKYIISNFKEKYIMDIRDYTYEKFGFYKRIVKQLIENSYFATISSKGFLKFLANSNKLIINHNINKTPIIANKPTLDKYKRNVIGFVGSVRYENENIALIKALKNSCDYELLYCGSIVNGCCIKEKVQQLGVQNVTFTGPFRNDEKRQIYSNIDIINSLYGNSSLEVTTAIPNRYYDAMLFKKPIIASKGTFLGELVENNHLGIVVDVFRDNVKAILKNYIETFDSKTFSDCCDKELKNVLNEQNCYYNFIKAFLMDNNGVKGCKYEEA